MQVKWVKSTSDEWLNLSRVNLSNVNVRGVYVIWQGSAKVVRVGQGDIKSRLTEHRQNNIIMRHAVAGKLFVTWATAPAHMLDGIERFLAEEYLPIEGERFPEAHPIAVNKIA